MNINTAEILAKNLINQHGLTDWKFEFDFSVRRFGCCHLRTKTITLSKALTELNPEASVKNMILHEIAHALLPIGTHHNEVWKNKALEIGCDGNRLYSNDRVVAPREKFISTCPNCGKTWKCNRRGKYACSDCCEKYNHGKFTKKYRLKYKRNI